MILFAAATLACLTPQAPERFPSLHEQDARRYDIELNIDLAEQRLTGTVDYTFTAVEELNSIRLDAQRSDDWQVTFRDLSGNELTSEWGEQHVRITLPQPAAKDSDIRFRAELRGKPVDGFYFKQNRYGDLMAFTDHYSIRARGWLPCEDNPDDRAVFSLVMHYPDGNEAVGFGMPTEGFVQQAKQKGLTTQALTGTSEIPPYMFAIVVGPLARIAEAGDPRLTGHLAYKQDIDKAKAALVHHAAWIAAMEQAFGRYPYGKYMTVQCPTRWGGFEAPGNVQLAESLFDNPTRGQGTLAHELVHMWFGDAVGYAVWREVWLSEGFASYFGPWLHAQSGGPTLSESMSNLRARWRQSFEGRTKSIRDDRFAHPDQALNSNTYPKGAWVLHMLRGEVGDDAFFSALKAYVAACRGRSVTTADFVEIIERETKTELSWFFEQWLDRIDCPTIRLTPGPNSIEITQMQKGDAYKFWIRLRWQNDKDEPVVKRIRVESTSTKVAITGACHDLQIDPKVELLFREAK
jgi:aminopeptidase N